MVGRMEEYEVICGWQIRERLLKSFNMAAVITTVIRCEPLCSLVQGL